MTLAERYIAVLGTDRSDVKSFLSHAIRLDEAAVVRVSARPDARLGLWTRTGFGVLATRAVAGEMAPADLVCDAHTLQAALAGAQVAVDPGFGMDSSWHGALPGVTGYRHVDNVAARELVELSRQGARLAKSAGSANGPATALLDQNVLSVSAADSAVHADISLRAVFALTAMGFIRDSEGCAVTGDSPVSRIAAAEPVRIRLSPSWIRIDARFGSIYQRCAEELNVLVR